MNNQNNLIMKEDKEQEVTHIEIAYSNQEELDELASSEIFRKFIGEKTLEKIEYAVEHNLEVVELFNIFNMSLIVELKKENFKPVLERIIKPFEDVEDYETCIKIKSIIKKL